MRTATQSIVSKLKKTPVVYFGIKLLQGEEAESLPHMHECFEIIWVIKGSGKHFIDADQHLIQSNQVFCIKPGQMHHFCPVNEVKGFSFFFTETFIQTGELEFDVNCQTDFFQLFSKFNGAVINPDISAELNEIVEKMQNEISNLYLFKNEILKRYLKIFLIYITRQFEGSLQTVVQTRNDQLVHSFKVLLDKHFKEEKMVADYSGKLFVTSNYLNEIIKKNTGYSASYHIRERIVLEAKRLALYSSLSMKEIAYELGFLDTAHFSKLFKMTTGQNFSQFKKEKIAFAIAV
jgi:AraC family transcriptional activator of pobA